MDQKQKELKQALMKEYREHMKTDGSLISFVHILMDRICVMDLESRLLKEHLKSQNEWQE